MSLWGKNKKPFLIAEIGGNHEGNFGYAKKLTELACRSGVDAVKFQIYTGDSLVNQLESPDRYNHFKRFELSKEQYIELYNICTENGVVFNASVWDFNAIEWIDPFMKFYKIGSGDLTAFPLLKWIAKIGKPIILSCGLATMDEIRQTVEFVQSVNSNYKKEQYFALLQCTSMYPIPDNETNLAFMNELKHEFRLATGFSDHTIGGEAVIIASAMGAEVIEFHFTDERNGKSFRDHKISFTCDEVQQFIKKIERIKIFKGDTKKQPTKSEIGSDHVMSFRRAIYPVRDLKSGTVIQEEDLIALRPNHGIDARDYQSIIGKKLRININRLQKLKIEYFE
ncbi:MAG: N-acetylneuraminate synthase [Bacteroidetes bacterium]|nr:N-acetylneuraminate synthase [Bacteroidota bacterium]